VYTWSNLEVHIYTVVYTVYLERPAENFDFCPGERSIQISPEPFIPRPNIGDSPRLNKDTSFKFQNLAFLCLGLQFHSSLEKNDKS